jgi:hypothetical protein
MWISSIPGQLVLTSDHTSGQCGPELLSTLMSKYAAFYINSGISKWLFFIMHNGLVQREAIYPKYNVFI